MLPIGHPPPLLARGGKSSQTCGSDSLVLLRYYIEKSKDKGSHLLKRESFFKVAPVAVAALTSAAGIGALIVWLADTGGVDVKKNVPGMDDPLGARAGAEAETAARNIEFGEIYRKSDVKKPVGRGNWPEFRGPGRDGISREKIKLADAFGPAGPPGLWETLLGPGYAAPAVFEGCVFIMDYDLDAGAEILRCLSIENGKEIWRSGYRMKIKSNHGISRTVPAVTEKYIVTFGARSHVMCVDTDTGKVRWGIDLEKRFGAETPMWHAGQCPLIDGDVAVLAPASPKALLIGVSCETGEIIWETPNPNGWKMSHSSIMPVFSANVRTYVYAAVGGVAGVAAGKGGQGKVLWQTSDWSASVVIPSPVAIHDSGIFLTSGYDGGSALIRINRVNEGYEAKTIYNFKGKTASKKCFSSYQQTPVYFRKHLFGIQLNGAERHSMEFACVDPNEPGGRFVWTSGKDTVLTSPRKKEGWGPYILADGKFYVLSDNGLLVVFEADTERRKKIGEWRLMDGEETWGPLAIAGGRLLMRDVNRLACFDISADTESGETHAVQEEKSE